MKTLLETLTKFAGEPEQKLGDQVKGTDKPKKGKNHTFKNKLVGGESAEPKSMLKDLSQAIDKSSLEWQLQEQYAQFQETEEDPLTKVYPDNAKGAKLFAMDQIDSAFLQNELQLDGASISPDPNVEGVWLIENDDTGFAVVIYMAGYKDPQGSIRKMNDFETFYPEDVNESMLAEATKDEEWQGWVIRYETTSPSRWMTYHKKRGPSDAHKDSAENPQAAIAAAKDWILSGGNAREITTTKHLTIDFNVKFVTDILNGGRDFFAKIVAGPTLIISDNAGPGFKRSHIRTQKSRVTSDSNLLPTISMSPKEAIDAGLKAHGRYILGDTSTDAQGNLSFPLIYQSTVQTKSDMMRLSKPGLTVAMERGASGEGISEEKEKFGTKDKRASRKGSRPGRAKDDKVLEAELTESTDDVSSIIVGEITKLIGDGHTEVAPDVIIAKVSAATGAPFMLKDLVAANNASPELQHYIDSINPSKVKFSTDILTVKNEDPMKDKQQAEAGVSKMAARAAARDRSLAEGIIHDEFNPDDFLTKLRKAMQFVYAHKKSFDSYTLKNIDTVYSLIRKTLMQANEEEFQRIYHYVAGKYPDAFDLLMDYTDLEDVSESSWIRKYIPGAGAAEAYRKGKKEERSRDYYDDMSHEKDMFRSIAANKLKNRSQRNADRYNKIGDKAFGISKALANQHDQRIRALSEWITNSEESEAHSRILKVFRVYTETLGYGMEFYNWANTPEALKLIAQKADTKPEYVKKALESLNWGQYPEEDDDYDFDDEEEDIVSEGEGEGKTAKNSLHTIIRVATHLNRQMKPSEDLPEWVSEEIGSIKDQMVTVMDYLISAKEADGEVSEGYSGWDEPEPKSMRDLGDRWDAMKDDPENRLPSDKPVIRLGPGEAWDPVRKVIVNRATKEIVRHLDEDIDPRWEKLRDAYKVIQNIDPNSPEYLELIAFLDGLSTEDLKSLANAKIKWVSGLARNRVNRRAMKESRGHREIARKLDQIAGRNKPRASEEEMAEFRKKQQEQKPKKKVNELATTATTTTTAAATGQKPAPGSQEAKAAADTAAALKQLKVAAGITQPDDKVAQAIDAAASGATDTSQEKVLQPLMQKIGDIAKDPNKVGSIKNILSQIK